jgi:hypothetical protein
MSFSLHAILKFLAITSTPNVLYGFNEIDFFNAFVVIVY